MKKVVFLFLVLGLTMSAEEQNITENQEMIVNESVVEQVEPKVVYDIESESISVLEKTKENNTEEIEEEKIEITTKESEVGANEIVKENTEIEKEDEIKNEENIAVESSSSDDIFGMFSSSSESTDSSSFGFGEDDGFGGMGEIIEDLKISGKLELPLRYMHNDQNVKESKTYFSPVFDLKVEYKKNHSETKVNIKFDKAKDEIDLTEASFKLFYKKFDVEVGKAKVVWGKGDKLHVIDTINANDYSDFINPDYIDRRIAEPMVKLNYFKDNSNLELIYTPKFTPDQVPVSGPWANPTFRDLNGAFETLGKDLDKELNKNDKADEGQFGIRYRNSMAGYDYGFTYYAGYIKRPSLNKAAVQKLQNTSTKAATLEDDQIAIFQKDAEITATTEGVKQQVAAGVAAGLAAAGLTAGTPEYEAAYNATYENEYQTAYNAYIQPLQNELLSMTLSIQATLAEIQGNPDMYYDPLKDGWEDQFIKELAIHYDPVHILGANLATIKMGVNWRVELGYYITKDKDGDKHDSYNNKFGYVIGGDKNIPINNLNVNIQVQGEKILNDDMIDKNGALDIEYDAEGYYRTNLIVTKITDKYYNNKINPELTFIYNLERKDYSVEPVIEFIAKDDTKIRLKYKVFEGDAGTNFGNYKKNDYLECSFKYEF